MEILGSKVWLISQFFFSFQYNQFSLMIWCSFDDLLLLLFQEKRITEERLKMQKDFEEEQEKSRKKEEEVQGTVSAWVK